MVRALPGVSRDALGRRGRIVSLLGVGQAIGRGALAVYTIALVRELTRGGYGDLAFALALVSILAAVGDGGFARLILRDVARLDDPRDKVVLLHQLLFVRAGWCVSVTVLAAASAAVGAFEFSTGFTLLMLVYLGTECLNAGFEWGAAASERPGRLVVAQSVGAAALLAWLAAFILLGWANPSLAIAGLAVASGLKLCAQMLMWVRPMASARINLRQLPVRTWITDAVPFLVLGLLAVLYYRLGILLLHVYRGPTETASFAAAFRIVEALAIVGGIVFSGISPPISRAHQRRPRLIWPMWKQMVRSAALVLCPLCILLFVMAEPIAGALFGDRYAKAAGEDLRLMAPGVFFMLLQGINSTFLFMGGDHRRVIILTLCNVALAAAVTLTLVRLAGSQGAAVAISSAEVVTFFGFSLLLRAQYADRDDAWEGGRSRSELAEERIE